MEIWFEVIIGVGDWKEKAHFSFDYDVTKEDLEDYAKYMEYSSVKEIFEDMDEKDEWPYTEIVNDILPNEKEYWKLDETFFVKNELKMFQEFIRNKYQPVVERWLCQGLTLEYNRSLKDVIEEINQQ